MLSFNEFKEQLNEALSPGEVSSGPADHYLETRAEKKAHAAHMDKTHGVRTKFKGDTVSYHGPKANVRKALINHYDGDEEDAKEFHPNVFKG